MTEIDDALRARTAGLAPLVQAAMIEARARLPQSATSEFLALTYIHDLAMQAYRRGKSGARDRVREKLATDIGAKAGTSNGRKTISVDINSEEFRSWFGNSVLTDAAGPLKLYHGTHFLFDRFDNKVGEKIHGFRGHYFTRCPRLATKYGKYLLTACVRMERPKRLDAREYFRISGITTERERSIRSEGFDGLILDDALGSEYVVFDSDQIRIIERRLA